MSHVLKSLKSSCILRNSIFQAQLRYKYTVMKTRFIFGTQCAIAMLEAGDRKLVLVSKLCMQQNKIAFPPVVL